MLFAAVWAAVSQIGWGVEPLQNGREAYAEALRKAAVEGKRLWIQLGKESCPVCERLSLFMGAHPSISDVMDESFIVLHLAPSRANIPLTREWGSPHLEHGLPVIVIVDQDGQKCVTAAASDFSSPVGEFSEERIVAFLTQWKAAPMKEVELPEMPK